MKPSSCVIMGSSCISHELELCQRSQIMQENGQACVASIIDDTPGLWDLPTLCTTATVQSYVAHHRPEFCAPLPCSVHKGTQSKDLSWDHYDFGPCGSELAKRLLISVRYLRNMRPLTLRICKWFNLANFHKHGHRQAGPITLSKNCR